MDNPSKTYLPSGFKSTAIAKATKDVFSKGPRRVQPKYIATALRPGDTTPRLLAGLCKAAGVRFLLCGYIGRKGPKLQKTVPGGVTDYVLTQVPCTSIVLRHKQGEDTARCALVCLDGSARAFRSLKEVRV